MSLLSSASIWTNDDSNKKRTPMLRKTIKKQPDYSPPSSTSATSQSAGDYVSEDQNYQDSQTPINASHTSMEETQTIQDSRGSRVNELLNKITAVDVENDGTGLASFNPPSNPELNQKKGTSDDLGWNPMNIPPPVVRKDGGTSNYSANNMNLAKLSNYQMSYEPPASGSTQPYYARMGLGNGGGSSNGMVDNKVMEKINYMIHLLEEQHNEKTNNVMEEFILYTFLGVFVIFIVDSFARAGKYTR